MRLPVRVFFRCLSFLLIFFLLLPLFTPLVQAQTPTPSTYQFVTPNVEADVEQNQHTYVQSLFIEILLAVQCQLTGIDFSDPTKSCLGLNLETGKLGYAPPSSQPSENMQIGGLLGMVNKGIATMYTPTFSSQEYFRYIASDFGIVKSTHAAAYTGFDGLQPVLQLWKTTRDIAYYLLIIAFIFIGIGVMLRLKIDPRTVMTVQNQIPRVIICIILITFSYAFAGLLIDTMWAVTYMGVNKITEAANPDLGNEEGRLNAVATTYLLDTPFGFAHEVFVEENSPNASGILSMAKDVGNAIAAIETDIILELLFGEDADASCGVTSLGDCPMTALVTAVNWVVSLIWFLIVFIALLIALFRIWFELIKAYIMVLLYVILGPLWIVFGLLPKRPLGFEKWLRVYFANLAVFPAVVLLLVGGRVLHELFNQGAQFRFVPPLIGDPELSSFGAIIEFAIVLMAPQLLSIIRDKLGTPPLKQTGAAMQTFNAARGAAGAPAKQALKHWNKRDQYGNAVGPLASMTDRVTNKVGTVAQKLPFSFGVGSAHDKKEYMKLNYGSLTGYKEAQSSYDSARAAAGPRGSAERKAFDDKYKGSVTAYAGENDMIGRAGAKRPPHIPGQPEDEGAETTPPPVTPTKQQPAAGEAEPGEAKPEEPKSGENEPAASPAGARQVLTIEFVNPGGSGTGTITIDPASSGSSQVHQIVLPQIESLPDSPQKSRLIDQINTERAENPTSHWNKVGSALGDEDRLRIQTTIARHLNPPGPSSETT